MNKTRLLAVLVGSVLVSSCANLSTLQTARTLPKGESRYLIGGGMFLVPNTSDGGGRRGHYPYLEGSVRKGLSETWEIGGKATLMGTLGFDGKYKIWEKNRFALATGAGIGFISFGLLNVDSKQSSAQTFIDLIAPIYASYDLGPVFTVYVSPKYVYRISNAKFLTEKSDNTLALLGGSLGVQLKFTEKEGVFIEGTSMRYLGRHENASQMNMGFYF